MSVFRDFMGIVATTAEKLENHEITPGKIYLVDEEELPFSLRLKIYAYMNL